LGPACLLEKLEGGIALAIGSWLPEVRQHVYGEALLAYKQKWVHTHLDFKLSHDRLKLVLFISFTVSRGDCSIFCPIWPRPCHVAPKLLSQQSNPFSSLIFQVCNSRNTVLNLAGIFTHQLSRYLLSICSTVPLPGFQVYDILLIYPTSTFTRSRRPSRYCYGSTTRPKAAENH
jgi:hypothetical protein